jgi:hypothetical protein
MVMSTSALPPAAPAEGAPASWRADAREAGRRRPFADIEQTSPGAWQRDFALFGAVTTLLATSGVLIFVPEEAFAVFIAGATVAAGIGGVAFGRFWHGHVRDVMRDASVASVAFLAAFLGALWGFGSAFVGAMLVAPAHDIPGQAAVIIGGIIGSVAGAFQCAWFAPAYALSNARTRTVVIAIFVSPALGWLALSFVGGAIYLFIEGFG